MVRGETVLISIIIPAINESEIITTAIERAWAAGADEIILADGGSRDGTPELARAAGCHVISAPLGRGPQLNAGAACASGDMLLFLHADNWLAPGACHQIRQAAQDLDVRFGGFAQHIENPAWIYRLIERGNRWRVRWRGLLYGDQAFFIQRSLFQELGGFPEIPIMEDLEFSRRLKGQGRAVLLKGPTYVDARRWQKSGPLRQTLRNWFLSTAYLLGVSPQRLAAGYRRHDQVTPAGDAANPDYTDSDPSGPGPRRTP